MTITKIDFAKVEDAIAAFDHIAIQIDRPDLIDAIAPLVDRYRAGIFRLVLVGEEKRGKSSLASALLGEPDLLPAGLEPMTSCVFKLVHGSERRNRIYFLPRDPDAPDRSRPDPIDVPAEELAAYGTEAGNPNNSRGVDFIAIEHPHPLLEAGLTIIDLPGLGGLKRDHGMLTLGYLPSADAVLFVVDSVSGTLNREEIVTLDRLRGFTDQIVFVQTKIDAVSNMQWKGWRDRNLEEIEKRLAISAADIRYFPVSSLLKSAHDAGGDKQDLVDSGFEPLEKMLWDVIIPTKQQLLAAPLLARIAFTTDEVRQGLENEMAILRTGTNAELESLEAMLAVSRDDHEAWKRDAQPVIITRFRDDFRVAELDAEREMALSLDSSDHGPIVGPILAGIEADPQVTGNELIEESAMWNDRAVDECGSRLDEIGQWFNDRICAAYDRAIGEIDANVRPLTIKAPSHRPDLPFERVSLKSHSTIWGTLMQGRLGLMAGTMVAGAVAHLIFPPFSIAVAAVSLVGGLFGAERSIRDAQQRERIQAENRIRMLLIDTVRRVQQYAMREFRAATEARHKEMLAGLHVGIRQRDREYQEAVDAIAARREQTDADIDRRIDLLREQLRMATALAHLLGEVPVGGCLGPERSEAA